MPSQEDHPHHVPHRLGLECCGQLSQRLGLILKHEEHRVGYLTQQRRSLTAAQDEVSSNHGLQSVQRILGQCRLQVAVLIIFVPAIPPS